MINMQLRSLLQHWSSIDMCNYSNHHHNHFVSLGNNNQLSRSPSTKRPLFLCAFTLVWVSEEVAKMTAGWLAGWQVGQDRVAQVKQHETNTQYRHLWPSNKRALLTQMSTCSLMQVDKLLILTVCHTYWMIYGSLLVRIVLSLSTYDSGLF